MQQNVRIIRITVTCVALLGALVLTLLKESPKAILLFCGMILVCWLHSLISWPDSFKKRPPPRSSMYVIYFIAFYIFLVCLFGLGYYAAGMMGHNIINKGSSLIYAVDSELKTQLDADQIPEIMRQKFKNLGNQLSDSATVSPEVPGSKWMIVDGNRTYTIIKQDGRLNVHELFIRSPRDFVYFSITTATTLGYGDLFPHGWLTKALSILEVSFGVIFITVVLTVTLGFRPTPVQGSR